MTEKSSIGAKSMFLSFIFLSAFSQGRNSHKAVFFVMVAGGEDFTTDLLTRPQPEPKTGQIEPRRHGDTEKARGNPE
jgi:hypothetical protein